MKKLIPFLIVIFTLFLLNSCFKANDSVGGHGGRCTGSAYCTACSNCSGCGHCSSGGTCGVCRGGSSGRSSSSGSSTKSKSKKHESSKAKSTKPPKAFIDEVKVNINSNNRYIAGIEAVNIYEKPSLTSKVITTVSKNTKLTQLSKEGSWYKVLIKSNGKKGYVFYKDVK
ncbi:SH3 domain-containing protein [Chryseobacterium sp. MEBOG07]|uniref:SH3 domain-containing protein n=1 Tax=Chryseobacterium sp. MEBOG07 TaxID=2879939 RepID=UPI001F38F7ED|nr:SH3 domain-containing protein [Chryseobacterium sp. MEBOG07]UKB79802.1 SH3 domain-containing protein [Chryseobacterium sp. MEBOG07]